MKKVVAMITILIMSCMLFTGCSTNKQSSNSRFETIEFSSGLFEDTCTIIVDKQTGVMYLCRNTAYGSGLTVMVDAHGNPLIYTGKY